MALEFHVVRDERTCGEVVWATCREGLRERAWQVDGIVDSVSVLKFSGLMF